MSEAIRCFQCGGHGFVIVEHADRDEEIVCSRCKGSGGLNLRCAEPGVPKSDDPYEPVPLGVNW